MGGWVVVKEDYYGHDATASKATSQKTIAYIAKEE
jgi:hypothetical protein